MLFYVTALGFTTFVVTLSVTRSPSLMSSASTTGTTIRRPPPRAPQAPPPARVAKVSGAASNEASHAFTTSKNTEAASRSQIAPAAAPILPTSPPAFKIIKATGGAPPPPPLPAESVPEPSAPLPAPPSSPTAAQPVVVGESTASTTSPKNSTVRRKKPSSSPAPPPSQFAMASLPPVSMSSIRAATGISVGSLIPNQQSNDDATKTDDVDPFYKPPAKFVPVVIDDSIPAPPPEPISAKVDDNVRSQPKSESSKASAANSKSMFSCFCFSADDETPEPGSIPPASTAESSSSASKSNEVIATVDLRRVGQNVSESGEAVPAVVSAPPTVTASTSVVDLRASKANEPSSAPASALSTSTIDLRSRSASETSLPPTITRASSVSDTKPSFNLAAAKSLVSFGPYEGPEFSSDEEDEVSPPPAPAPAPEPDYTPAVSRRDIFVEQADEQSFESIIAADEAADEELEDLTEAQLSARVGFYREFSVVCSLPPIDEPLSTILEEEEEEVGVQPKSGSLKKRNRGKVYALPSREERQKLQDEADERMKAQRAKLQELDSDSKPVHAPSPQPAQEASSKPTLPEPEIEKKQSATPINEPEPIVESTELNTDIDDDLAPPLPPLESSRLVAAVDDIELEESDDEPAPPPPSEPMDEDDDLPAPPPPAESLPSIQQLIPVKQQSVMPPKSPVAKAVNDAVESMPPPPPSRPKHKSVLALSQPTPKPSQSPSQSPARIPSAESRAKQSAEKPKSPAGAPISGRHGKLAHRNSPVLTPLVSDHLSDDLNAPLPPSELAAQARQLSLRKSLRGDASSSVGSVNSVVGEASAVFGAPRPSAMNRNSGAPASPVSIVATNQPSPQQLQQQQQQQMMMMQQMYFQQQQLQQQQLQQHQLQQQRLQQQRMAQNVPLTRSIALKLRAEELQFYEYLFSMGDQQFRGELNAKTVYKLFVLSELPQHMLMAIWQLAAQSRSVVMTKDDFFVALRLIALTQHGFLCTLESLRTNLHVPLPKFNGITMPIAPPAHVQPLMQSVSSIPQMPVLNLSSPKASSQMPPAFSSPQPRIAQTASVQSQVSSPFPTVAPSPLALQPTPAPTPVSAQPVFTPHLNPLNSPLALAQPSPIVVETPAPILNSPMNAGRNIPHGIQAKPLDLTLVDSSTTDHVQLSSPSRIAAVNIPAAPTPQQMLILQQKAALQRQQSSLSVQNSLASPVAGASSPIGSSSGALMSPTASMIHSSPSAASPVLVRAPTQGPVGGLSGASMNASNAFQSPQPVVPLIGRPLNRTPSSAASKAPISAQESAAASQHAASLLEKLRAAQAAVDKK